MKNPNFIFICTDQQRSDSLGCYGNQYARTPNIDSIAQSGMRFTRHITPMQICSPSRATMATGLYPRNHTLAVNGMALPESVPTLPAILSDHGYRTHSVGKQHLQPLLAPANKNMPDSRAFWDKAESMEWNGPYYGYQTLDLLLGESDTAHLAGHYANWLHTNHPGMWKLLLPESDDQPVPPDLDEIWRCALPVELHYNTWITHCATEFIHSMCDGVIGDGNRPFFLFVSYPDPHHPFDPPAEYADRYDASLMPLPRVEQGERSGIPSYCSELYPTDGGFRESYWSADEGVEAGSMIITDHISDDSLRKAVAYTHAMVEMIDDGVGAILEALNHNGLMDHSHIIFTSDHGEYLGDHGLLHKGPASYRQLTEVSMLVKGPGIPRGAVSNALTNHIDLAPTILELSATDGVLDRCDGESLVPVLSQHCHGVRQYNFGEYHPTVRRDLYNQTIQNDKWRLTLYPQRPEWGELFDLENDPMEHFNLFNQPGNGEVIKQLSAVLGSEFPPQSEVDNEVLCKW